MTYSKYGFLFYISIFLSIHLVLKPEIREINSIEEVKEIFEQATQDDAFVFDVDGVILEPVDVAQQIRFSGNQEVKSIVDDFFAFIKASKSADDYADFIFDIYFGMKPQKIEQALIDKILNLQKRNIKVIALTLLSTGNTFRNQRFEDWRYRQLLNLGIDFSLSFKSQEIVFNELSETNHAKKRVAAAKDYHCPAIFYKGVICTAGFTKGVVLRAFWEKIGWRPAHVYFFDDQIENVQSVVHKMEKMGIMCSGFVYKAATFNRNPEDLDIKVVRFQYDWMKKLDGYASYFEAKDYMEQLAQVF